MAKKLPPTKGMLTDGSTSIPNIPPYEEIEDREGLMGRLLALLGGIGQSELGAIWADPTMQEILDANTVRMNPEAPFDIEYASGVNANVLGQIIGALENATTEAQDIADTLFEDPSALSDMEDPGALVTSILESSALGFLGPPGASPVSTTPQGIVLPGGAGVTIDFEELGSISDINLEAIFEKLKGYIPGISLPSWLPSAGVIFIPELQDKIRQVDEAIGGVIDSVSGVLEGEEDVQGVLDAIGGVIGEVFDAVVYNEEATTEEEEGILQSAVGSIFDVINGVLEGTADSSTIGTIISGVATSVLGTSLPNWLPGVLTTVFTPGSPVISTVQQVLSDMGITLPFTEEEEEVDINEDDTTYIDDTIKADIKFPEEPEPEPEPEPETGPVKGDPIKQAPLDPDESIVEDLFSDIIGQTEANILQAIADAGYATPQDVVDAISEAGLLTAESLATTLANAGFATPEDIGTALADAGFATPQDIADALSAAGFATPEDLATALSNAGYATPEDLVTALSSAGFATPEDIATALTNAGLATPQDIADAFDAAGLATPQDVIDAISAAGLATPQDVADALEAFGFTDAQLQQIAGALPEGLTLDQLNTALSDALAGIATGTDLDTATTTITDAIGGLGFATAEDVRTALSEFGFTDAQLEQIVNALPEGLSTTDLENALEGVVVGADLDTAVTTITDAIGGLDIASAQDVRDALAEFNFTEDQLNQIINALPEGLSTDDLATALSDVVVGDDLTAAVTTITDAIGGLDIASPDDIRNILSNYGFTDAQLQQIVGALPEGLSLSDVTGALETAMSGIALGTDIDSATNTITDAISGLAFATPEDVANALTQFGFTEDQLNQIAGVIPEGLSISDLNDALGSALSGIALGSDLETATTTITDAIGGLNFATADDVANALANFGFSEDQLNQIAGVIPEGLTLNQLNDALTGAVSGLALGTDLDAATTTITDAIGGLNFATAQDVQDALTAFNFTESQLNQISGLLPDNLTQTQVQDLLTTSLSGVSTQENVDEAFATLTTNLTTNLSGLEAGQEEILTGQEGLFGGQQDILTGVGEESQRLEDIIMSSTGLLAAIGAGGLGGGAPARPRPEPYRPYMEKLDYAPGMVEALKPQQQVDYNKEVDRLLTMGMGGRKQGMLV
jgi:hypothetical protein